MNCTHIRHTFLFTLMVGAGILFLNQAAWSADKVLATINGQNITSGDLKIEQNLLQIEMRLRNRPVTDRQVQALQDDIIDNLVAREVLFQYADEKNIRARSQSVKTAFDDLKEQLGGRSALNAYLAAGGITQEQLKDRLDRGLIVRRLLRRDAVRSIKISEAEIEAFYRNHPEYFQRGEQVRVRHILVTEKQGDGNASARTRIGALQKQLEMGADFAVLALEFSDCPSRSSAGDLGFLTRQQMVADFADAAFSLHPGEISGIVTTRYGYHLIQMLERKPPEKISYKEAREKIERSLRRNKENTAVKRFIAQLKKDSDIKLTNP